MVVPRRFEIFLVALDPTTGPEMRKTRPCVIVSPDEANDRLRTVVVVPMTTKPKGYPSRVRVRFEGKDGEAALDQIRSIDKSRLRRRLGVVSQDAAQRITATLLEFFA